MMNILKRISNQILKGAVVGLLMLSILAIGATAAQAVVDGYLEVDPEFAIPGGQVTVIVHLDPSASTTLYGIDAYLYYDSSVVEVASIDNTLDTQGQWFLNNVVDDPSNDRVSCSKGAMAAMGLYGLTISADYELYAVTFNVLPGAAMGPNTIYLGRPADGAFFTLLNEVNANVTGTATDGEFDVIGEITSLGDNDGYQGDLVTTTINGENFTGANAVEFSGSGVTGTISNVTASSCDVSILVAGNAASGARNVTIKQGSTVLAYGASKFTVQNDSVVLSPDNGIEGNTIAVSVAGTGTHFNSNLPDVVFSGSGVTVTDRQATSNTSMTFNAVIANGAAAGNRTVTITVSGVPGGGTETMTDTFTVVAAAAGTVTNVNPGSAYQGDALEDVVITGTGFTGAVSVSMGSGITASNVTVNSDTELTVDLEIDASTTAGNKSVSVSDGSTTIASGSNQFTVNASSITIDPVEGDAGETVSVTINGTGSHFTASTPTIDGGTDITVTNVSVTDDETLTADFELDSAASGAQTITVTTTGVPGGGDEELDVTFTINEASEEADPDIIVIDDFEGGHVTTYTTYGDGNNDPTFTRQGTEVHEGSNAAEILYNFNATSMGDWGGGVEAPLNEVIDFAHAQSVSLMVKGDGSTNSVRLDLIEDSATDGEIYSSPAIPLSGTDWTEVSFSVDEFTINEYSPSGNGTFDQIIEEYRLVYTTTGTSAANHYVDYIVASVDTVAPTSDAPVIDAVTPNEAAIATIITINGSNFGATQNDSQVIFDDAISTLIVDEAILWSDTLIQIAVPEGLESKAYALKVYKRDLTLGVDALSNAVAFTVIAMADIVKAYPNPFNPLVESTSIQVSVTSTTNVGIYIYDITARLVYKTVQTLNAGTTLIPWDGKLFTGEYCGDGVYLVRVVNEDSKTLLSKGKIIAIKR
ncbi:MAG: IPT/TIG domain-containing protein [Candidatus Margulisbacteria bacterium]|nr:IPT/TIG domain-containing protein [Candidatus Margulisiibacteriota bacterium]MBU1021455.1 IPT/TIG domain-containing protein [Candidatus Margulisiibacteriota bacterium]MBU1728376.1 IPT/TIG domain-containing protein [Candidatus Margulisiibacteriota bacterium]MBU1955881.1 IPT/TIG domain-containing protein [Candidatus Margulisiibacteriota bacterium]